MTDEIVRRLRSRNPLSMNSLKESMPVNGINEEDEDIEKKKQELIDSGEDIADEVDTDNDTPQEEPIEDEDTEDTPIEDEDFSEEEENEYVNPLDNPYAVKFKLGDSVALSYNNGTKSKLKGIIEGYDQEGFYRVKWNNGMLTNGITDIAISDALKKLSLESKCVCGSNKFVNESKGLVCDVCGRIIERSSDLLTIADKSRPKGKKLIRSEAHPVSTSINSDIGESIRSAFKKSKNLKEGIRSPYFDYLRMKLEGEFWTVLEELVRDIEELGYIVDDYNPEYVVVVAEEDEKDHTVLIPIGGTSRTLTLNFDSMRSL